MTLVSSIITDAYRESNLIAISTSPTTAEVTEALRLVNRIFYSVFGTKMGENLSPFPIGRNNIEAPSGYPGYTNTPYSDWIVPDNTQLVLNLTEATTVNLNPAPRDGARLAIQDASGNLATYNLTINGNGRLIEAASSATLSTDSLVREWFFRADLGDWKRISALIASDTWPFPEKYDDLFITALAMRLNPRYSNETGQETIEAYRTGLKAFRAQYRQVAQMGSELGLTRLTSTHRTTDLGGDYDLFETGRPYP